jgi:hypothetical protein
VILDDQRNVIARISGHLKTIHGVHETIFLHEFQKKIEKWDIKSPDFAGVLKHNAEFLKVCCPFLKEKRTLQNDLRLLLESDNEFASATKAV